MTEMAANITDIAGDDAIEDDDSLEGGFSFLLYGGEGLTEAAETVLRLRMYPYFEIAHYILVCLLVREDFYSQHIAGAWSFRGSLNKLENHFYWGMLVVFEKISCRQTFQ